MFNVLISFIFFFIIFFLIHISYLKIKNKNNFHKKNEYKDKIINENDYKKIINENPHIEKSYLNEDYFKIDEIQQLFKRKQEESKFLNPIPILNYNELNFYNQLKIYLQWKNYLIFSKVRLADFLKIDNNLSYWENQKIFNKISKKHIDFLITDTKSKIICLIELDGLSHNYWKTKLNDEFKNNIFYDLDIKLYRFKNAKSYNLNILGL